MGSKSPSGNGWGCGIYAQAHAVQWAGGFSMNSSNGGELLDAFITKNHYPWLAIINSDENVYASVIASYGVSTEPIPATQTGLQTFFNNGGAIVTNIPGHYQCAVGMAIGNNGETWIHMVDSTCYSTIYRLNDKGYSAYNFSTGAVQSSTSNYGGGEYWISYTAYQNAFSKRIAMTGNGIAPVFAGTTPVNLGEDFYAYIFHQSDGLCITDKGDNVCVEEYTGASTQKWRFQRLKNGSYTLLNVGNSSYMDVFGAYTEGGSNVYAYRGDYLDIENQQFYVYYAYDAYYICPVHGKGTIALDVNASTHNLEVYDIAHDWAPQKFDISIIPVSSVILNADKTDIGVGESIIFSFQTNQLSHCWLHVYKDDNEVMCSQVTNILSTSGVTTYSFTSPGTYTVYIGAAGGGSEVASNAITIRVANGPILNVQPGSNIRETLLTWNEINNADSYGIQILDANGDYAHVRWNYNKTAFTALLPPGSYQARVIAVCGNTNKDGSYVPFVVSSENATQVESPLISAVWNNTLYALYDKDCSWLEAKALCEQEGGHLVTITSQDEQDVVSNLVYQYGLMVYMGAEGYTYYNWRWITDETFTQYTNWNEGQPDNWDGKENCGMLYTNGTWNDICCTDEQVHGFIAEYPPVDISVTPSDDLLSLLDIDYEQEMEEQTAYYTSHIRDHLTVQATFSDGTEIAVDDYEVTTKLEQDAQKPFRYLYAFTITYGDLSDTSEISITLNPDPVFGIPDFTLPSALTIIDESAFEGIAASVVYVPDTCTGIGRWTFRNCPNLTQIRIPANCSIGTDAFDGCDDVVIFGTKGSAAETYANNHENCTFVAE